MILAWATGTFKLYSGQAEMVTKVGTLLFVRPSRLRTHPPAGPDTVDVYLATNPRFRLTHISAKMNTQPLTSLELLARQGRYPLV